MHGELEMRGYAYLRNEIAKYEGKKPHASMALRVV